MSRLLDYNEGDIHGRTGEERVADWMLENPLPDEPIIEPEEAKMGSDSFTIKDSGKREEFSSGMVRDTQDDKADFTRLLDGPMFDRWAVHLTKGEKKYKDIAPGVPNWTLANGEAELMRFKKSAFRHFRQWLRGDRDEDHAAAVYFNVNGYEYVLAKLSKEKQA